MPTFLELTHISKRFGGVQALADVDLTLESGEVHCLVGENGSGKSTLIKIISGVQPPEAGGKIIIESREYSHLNPVESTRAGIQVIYQDLSLFPNLTVAENIGVGQHLGGFHSVDWNAIRATAKRAMERIGVTLDLDVKVEDLSIANRQLVAICRAMAADAKLVIMDEPTAALGVKESRRVLELILDVKKRGMPIVLISHNMPHVFEVADRIHINRLGRRLCVINPKDYSMSDAVAFMTGAKEPPPEAVAA